MKLKILSLLFLFTLVLNISALTPLQANRLTTASSDAQLQTAITFLGFGSGGGTSAWTNSGVVWSFDPLGRFVGTNTVTGAFVQWGTNGHVRCIDQYRTERSWGTNWWTINYTNGHVLLYSNYIMTLDGQGVVVSNSSPSFSAINPTAGVMNINLGAGVLTGNQVNVGTVNATVVNGTATNALNAASLGGTPASGYLTNGGYVSADGSGLTKLPRWPKKFFFISDSKGVSAVTNQSAGSGWNSPGGYTNQFCVAYTNGYLAYPGGGFTYSNTGFDYVFQQLSSNLQGQNVQIDGALQVPGIMIANFGRGYNSWESTSIDQPSYGLTYNAQGTNASLIYCGSGVSYTYRQNGGTADTMIEILGTSAGNIWFTNNGTNFNFTPQGSGGYKTIVYYGTPGLQSSNIITQSVFPGTSSFLGSAQFAPPYKSPGFGTNNEPPLRWLVTNSPIATGISSGVYINGGGNDRGITLYSAANNGVNIVILQTNGWQFTFSNLVYTAQFCKTNGYWPVILSTYDIDPGFSTFTTGILTNQLNGLLNLNSSILALRGQTNICDYVYDESVFTAPYSAANALQGIYTNYMASSTAHWQDSFLKLIGTNYFNAAGFNSSYLPNSFAGYTDAQAYAQGTNAVNAISSSGDVATNGINQTLTLTPTGSNNVVRIATNAGALFFQPTGNYLTSVPVAATNQFLTSIPIGATNQFLTIGSGLTNTTVATMVLSNFPTGSLVSNSTGVPIVVIASAASSTAAVAGMSQLALYIVGTITNYSRPELSTISSLSGTVTNPLAGVIPVNAQYGFFSVGNGAGDTSIVCPGANIYIGGALTTVTGANNTGNFNSLNVGALTLTNGIIYPTNATTLPTITLGPNVVAAWILSNGLPQGEFPTPRRWRCRFVWAASLMQGSTNLVFTYPALSGYLEPWIKSDNYSTNGSISLATASSVVPPDSVSTTGFAWRLGNNSATAANLTNDILVWFP